MTAPDSSWFHRETHRWNHTVEMYTSPDGRVHIRLLDNSGVGAWVDPSRPVEAYAGGVDVPLQDPQLATACTPTCAHTAAYVLKMLAMDLRRKPDWGSAYTIPSAELLLEEALLLPRLTADDVDQSSAIRRWRALEKASIAAAQLSGVLPACRKGTSGTRL